MYRWAEEERDEDSRGLTPSSTLSSYYALFDVEAKAFVEDMKEHWDERRGKSGKVKKKERKEIEGGESLYSLETMKKDYRLRKQRVPASLWVIQLIEEILSRHGRDDLSHGYDLLKELDPVAANRIHPNNHRKVNQYLSLHANRVLPSKLYQGNAAEVDFFFFTRS